MYTKMPRYQIQNEKIEYKVENSQKFSASSSATFLCKKTLCKYFLQVLPSIAPSLPELTQHFPEMVPQCLNFKSEEMWIFCSQIDNFQVFFAAYGHWLTFDSNCLIFFVILNSFLSSSSVRLTLPLDCSIAGLEIKEKINCEGFKKIR